MSTHIDVARAFCAEHGIDEKHAPAVADLIVAVKSETEALCGDKAMRAVERAWEDGANSVRVDGPRLRPDAMDIARAYARDAKRQSDG